MKSLIKFQLFVLLAVLIIIGGVVGAFLYAKHMTIQNGALNISKIQPLDKLYTYSIFSDFYFSVSKYGEDGNNPQYQYSVIIPTETSLGFNLQSNQSLLTARDTNEEMVLIDKSSSDSGEGISHIVHVMKQFAKNYGQIVATQDADVLQNATTAANQINKSFLKETKTQFTPPVRSDFYQQDITLAVDNLKISPFKLSEIPLNQKQFEVCSVQSWCPDLFRWTFGERDQIYLQYLQKFKNSNIEDFLQKTNKVNATIVKTVKFNEKGEQKFFFKIKDDKNEIESYFIDPNGYVYLLKYVAMNKSSFDKYLPDYLKIAYGLRFVDTPNFSNNFASEQQQVISNYNMFVCDLLKERFLDQILEGKGLLQHFGLKKIDTNLYYYKELSKMKDLCQVYSGIVLNQLFPEVVEGEHLKFSQVFEKYKSLLGHYPTKDDIDQQELADKSLVMEASEKYRPGNAIYSFIFGSEKDLTERCNTISCLKELKKNNWEAN